MILEDVDDLLSGIGIQLAVSVIVFVRKNAALVAERCEGVQIIDGFFTNQT